MIRVKQYRPSLKDRYSRVKTSQFSEKATEVGIYYAIDNIAYRGRFAIGEEITKLSVSTYHGKLGGVHIYCSNPKYDWDRGYKSFFVHSSLKPKESMKYSWEEEKQIEHEELLQFLIGCKKFFEEEGLNPKITDDDMNETTLEELILSFSYSQEETEEEPAEAEEDVEQEETEENETEIEETENEEMINMNEGYERDAVLLEAGEFEIDGRTFTYEGEPITVQEVLEDEIQMLNFPVAEEDYKGVFILTSTGTILCRVSSYNRELKHLFTYDKIVYSPRFEEIYPTAEEFIESRIELLDTYQPTKEFKEEIDYCTYKGRLYKDLINMTTEELQAINNEEAGAEILAEDVENYVKHLIIQANNPKTWMAGVNITEELMDYHIRHNIGWGIKYCEQYCSPAVEFFRLAEKVYQSLKGVPIKELYNILQQEGAENLTITETIGIATCHKIMNEIEEFRWTHEKRERGVSLEELLEIRQKDIRYFQELYETLDDVRSEMPSHSFESMTIRGMETFTLLNSEQVTSAFMSAGIKINFWLDSTKAHYEYEMKQYLQTCREDCEKCETAEEFISEAEHKIHKIRTFIDEGDFISEELKEKMLKQVEALETEKLYKKFLTLTEVKEIVAYYNRKGITCDSICAYIPLKKEHIREIRDTLIYNYAESVEEADEMEKMNTVKELRAFIKEHMGDDWAIYKGNFINAVTYSQ